MSTPSILAEQVVAAIRAVVGPGPTALHEPRFIGNEWMYLKECLDSTFVSSVGKFVDRFEAELVAFTGAKHAIAVINGTSALHICLKLADVSAGDEVLIPSLTFVATANAVAYQSAIPHFVDCDESTLGLDPGKLEDYLRGIAEVRGNECFNRTTGARIKAAVPMHTFGHPVDLEPLMEICARYHLELVEDAAESLGSYYKGRHTGTFGRLGVLSFNGNKIMTTGGGGAILTNDVRLGRLAKHITTTARIPDQVNFFHDQLGYNYRLPNINAALGCAQLEQLPRFVEQKRKLSERYRKAFTDVAGARFFTEPRFAKSNYWLNAILLDAECQGDKLRVLEATNSKGFMTRPAWVLMHKLPMYKNCPRMDLTVAESLEARIINIPSSADL